MRLKHGIYKAGKRLKERDTHDREHVRSKTTRQFLQRIKRRQLITRITPAEKIVKEWLVKSGQRFIFQKGFIDPFSRIVDFYLPDEKVIIEVDGLSHITTQELDKVKDFRWLREKGIKTLRFTNTDAYTGAFKKIITDFLCQPEESSVTTDPLKGGDSLEANL